MFGLVCNRMRFMERLEFELNFTKAFEAWKKGDATVAEIADLSKAVDFARANGIDLFIKVPKCVLDETAATRPMLRQDAIDFTTGIEDDLLVFSIPAQINKHSFGSRGLEMKVASDYRDFESCILLRNRSVGTFAVLLPSEVASIGLK